MNQLAMSVQEQVANDLVAQSHEFEFTVDIICDEIRSRSESGLWTDVEVFVQDELDEINACLDFNEVHREVERVLEGRGLRIE